MNISHIQRKLNVGYPRAKYLQKYIEYIETVGGDCRVEWFDEDWYPIGPDVRTALLKAGVIHEQEGLLFVCI